MGFFVPALLIGGGIALAKALSKDKPAHEQQNVRPPAKDTPDGPGKGPVSPPANSPVSPPPASLPIPAGTPIFPPVPGGGMIDPRSPAGNAIANQVQPPPLMNNGKPADQPPLPQAPPQSALPVGLPAYVTTKETGNAGALRVRIAPSTQAKVIAGGEPEDGGGIEHGAQVRITGPLVAGFSPVTGPGRHGGTLTGFAWAGYLTGAAVAEVGAANAGNAPTIVAGEGTFGEDYKSETDTE